MGLVVRNQISDRYKKVESMIKRKYQHDVTNGSWEKTPNVDECVVNANRAGPKRVALVPDRLGPAY
jgi:hypothetical protein